MDFLDESFEDLNGFTTHLGTMSRAHFSMLLRDLETIHAECMDGKTMMVTKPTSSNTGFFGKKEEITLLMDEISSSIKERNDLFTQYGRTRTVISLSMTIHNQMERVKELFNQLEHQLERDKNRFIGRLSLEEYESRKNMCSLLQTLILDMESLQVPSTKTTNPRSLTSLARKEIPLSSPSSPSSFVSIELSSLDESFVQQVKEKDEKIDAKLDSVLQGVVVLKEISLNIKEEVQVQTQIIQASDQKVSQITPKFSSANQKMRIMLDASGGAIRWCPIFVIIILLVALCGYILTML